MLERVLSYIHNWFTEDSVGNEYPRWHGEFTIADGELELPLLEGQYFRIIGSVLNDGLHKYPADDLKDETFNGSVLSCVIPKAVILIADEIEAWNDQYGDQAASPYVSESFGGYSYTKSSGGSNSQSIKGWQDAFGASLIPWKKVADA